jgi:hypothetical protein
LGAEQTQGQCAKQPKRPKHVRVVVDARVVRLLPRAGECGERGPGALGQGQRFVLDEQVAPGVPLVGREGEME